MLVTAKPLPFVERLTFLPRLFGPKLMMRAEALLFTYAGRFSPDDYNGGLWEYYTLSNGGGYAAPLSPERFRIHVMGNGFEGDMSNDAAGIVVSLFVLNTLAFECSGKDEQLTEKLVNHWDQLRDFAQHHAEASSIYRAID